MERYLSIAATFLFPLLVMGKTIRVHPGPDRPIQQAISKAAPGDTIEVAAGIYPEKGLTITKPIFIKGIGYPVLDGENHYEIITIKSDRVTLQGFIIRNSGYSGWNDIAGVRIVESRYVTVRQNKFEDTYFGLYFQNSADCTLADNQFHSWARPGRQAGNGIHCWHCNTMLIAGNTITGHRDGIYFEFVTNSVITGNNSFSNQRYGLHFMFSHNDRYANNRFSNNEAGVSVMFSHGVEMQANTFADNLGGGAFGILLKEITDSRIEANHFQHNTVAIYMEGTTRIQVRRNTFSDNGWALKVQASCSADTISKNNFKGNTFDVATNGSLVLNNFDRNYWDKYEGYDLNRDGLGDVPYHPVSLYAMVAEKNPSAMMLFHSFMVSLLDRTERVLPGTTPAGLADHSPNMKPFPL